MIGRKKVSRLAVMVFALPLWAKSPDQTSVELSLRTNAYFLWFINISVSNFGNEIHKRDLLKAYNHDFQARIWFLQGEFVKANNEIIKSQDVLKRLYYEMLSYYIDDAKLMLESSAPEIIRSKDLFAQHYLQLGFRDLKNSKEFLKLGFNYNRLLFKNKIKIYIEGLKRVRRAKRYAILGIIESRTPRQDKPQFRLQTFQEYLHPEVEEIKLSSYDRIRNRLINLMNRKLISPKIKGITRDLDLLHQHDDNYAIISKDRTSILDVAKPDFDPTAPLPESKALILERDIVKEREAFLKKQREAEMKKLQQKPKAAQP